MAPLELVLAYLVLLPVMIGTKADYPSVGWFETHSSIRPATDMCALDRHSLATRH